MVLKKNVSLRMHIGCLFVVNVAFCISRDRDCRIMGV